MKGRIYDHPGHPLHGRPVLRRMDAFAYPLLEIFCEHGVGHPMPESVEMLTKLKIGGGWSVHGCDGCCRQTQPEEGNHGATSHESSIPD